jgi:phosphoserine phosphatase
MTTTLDPAAREFLQRVLSLAPRIAVFDCDGTLWAGDSGQDFFYYELERGLIPKPVADRIRPRYADYLQGKIDEETMCGQMVTMHAGIAEEKIVIQATEFFRAQIEKKIFAEMLELTHQLATNGCEIWAVSSTNEWVVREGVRRFGIPAERVLAASVYVERGFATSRLRSAPTDGGKATAIRANISARLDAVFGNSMHDAAMLEMAKHAFAINPTHELEPVARQRGWTIYYPLAVRSDAARPGELR